jgi:hypothetical protein
MLTRTPDRCRRTSARAEPLATFAVETLRTCIIGAERAHGLRGQPSHDNAGGQLAGHTSVGWVPVRLEVRPRLTVHDLMVSAGRGLPTRLCCHRRLRQVLDLGPLLSHRSLLSSNVIDCRQPAKEPFPSTTGVAVCSPSASVSRQCSTRDTEIRRSGLRPRRPHHRNARANRDHPVVAAHEVVASDCEPGKPLRRRRAR